MSRLVIAGLVLVGSLALGCAPESPTRTSFVVEGMHCGSCSSAIVDALMKTEGVLSASADHERGTAEAVHEAKTVGPEQLAQTIEGLGYEVTEIHTANDH